MEEIVFWRGESNKGWAGRGGSEAGEGKVRVLEGK